MCVCLFRSPPPGCYYLKVISGPACWGGGRGYGEKHLRPCVLPTLTLFCPEAGSSVACSLNHPGWWSGGWQVPRAAVGVPALCLGPKGGGEFNPVQDWVCSPTLWSHEDRAPRDFSLGVEPVFCAWRSHSGLPFRILSPLFPPSCQDWPSAC